MRERCRGVGQKRRGGEEGEERCKEANTKFKIQPCSSIKINATRTQSCVIKLCVLLNVTAYSELSSYVSIPRATDIYLPLCPLLHLFLSLSLFFSLHISVSLPCSINCKWSVLRWNTLWAGLHGWQLCVCMCVCSCLVNNWNAHSGPFSRFWERTHACIFSYVFVLPVCIILLKDAQCCQPPTYTWLQISNLQ